MILKTNSCVLIYLLLILINFIKTTNAIPPDLTYIIKTNESGYIRPLCIGEGDVLNSAITWIYPIPDAVQKLPRIDSDYVPQRNAEYSCNFAKSKKCNTIWQANGWQYSTFHPYNFKPIIDSRWEGFPTFLTSNSTNEFITRVDIPNTFEIGFSIRASKNAEIFVCEGWNPKAYPCYYINIGGADNKNAFLRKYKNGIPDKFSKNDTKLAKYRSDINILSEEEWKTYSLSLSNNGLLILSDVFNKATLLNYTDKVALKPISFIVRSKNENALWKIHKNDFMFANNTGILKFGPKLELYGNELCVSFYVLMCAQCRIKFFIEQNGQKDILREIINTDDVVWMKVKLQKDKFYEDSVQIYAETDNPKSTEMNNTFWAVDNVRVCTAKELKITHLNISMTFKDFQKTHIVCQSLKHPNWRPIHQISRTSTVSGVACNTSTSNSIKLSWKPTTEDKNFEEYCIVQYEGSDICKYGQVNPNVNSSIRRKSQGYVIDKNNEIDIKDLIPYTFYKITFWNVIDDVKNYFEISTTPTDMPAKVELPKLKNMSISDSVIDISWDNPKCNDTYGPLAYQLSIKNTNSNNTRYFVDLVTQYKFENLVPFTNYTLEIRTARKTDNLNDTKLFIKTIYNFTTKPGIAPKVENLELYSIDKSTASFRFDLPKQTRGIPKYVQIRWCHPLYLSGCLTDSQLYNLTQCTLWNFKHCLNVSNLVQGDQYQFNVAIKNEDTYTYGAEATVNGTAVERVPGKPSNISYKLVNCNKIKGYCNLNVTFVHPYNQNGTITMFDVILTESSYTYVEDTSKIIREIVKIQNSDYQKMYHCIVKYITDIPYKISVRAVNDHYKSEFEEIIINYDNPEGYVDQTPEYIECTNETMKFKLPKLNERLKFGTLVVIVQDYDQSKNNILVDDVLKLEMFGGKYQLCNEYGETWVAKTVNLSTTDPQFLIVGDESLSYIPELKKSITNKQLNPNTEYCFTFALISENENSETLTVFHSKNLFTQRNSFAEKQEGGENLSVNAAAYVIPILVIIALICSAAWFSRKYFMRKRLVNGEHIYESMPFDDYLPDAVSNQNYDRLIHT